MLRGFTVKEGRMVFMGIYVLGLFVGFMMGFNLGFNIGRGCKK